MISANLFYGFLLFSLFRVVMETHYPIDAMGFIVKNTPKEETISKSILFVVGNVFESFILFGIYFALGSFIFSLLK